MNEELDLLLAAPPLESRGNREAMLVATTRVIRRRAFVRRIPMNLAVAAVVLGSFALGWLAKPMEEKTVVVMVPSPVVEPAALVEPAPATPEPLPQLVQSVRELEQQAELSDDPPTVARLYREAGDRYLNESKDYSQAARCYRLFLNVAPVADQRVAASDTWMLISLKTALPKE